MHSHGQCRLAVRRLVVYTQATLANHHHGSTTTTADSQPMASDMHQMNSKSEDTIKEAWGRSEQLKTGRFALGPKNVHQPWPLAP